MVIDFDTKVAICMLGLGLQKDRAAWPVYMSKGQLYTMSKSPSHNSALIRSFTLVSFSIGHSSYSLKTNIYSLAKTFIGRRAIACLLS